MNATGSILLDTSVTVDYLRQDRVLHERIDQTGDVHTPLVVLGELLYGAYKSKRKDKMLAQVREFSQDCILILSDETTAEFCGQMKAARYLRQNDPGE